MLQSEQMFDEQQREQESTIQPSSEPTQPDILLVGHVTCDLESADPNSACRLGGTVSFAAVTAMRLGRHPTIVTRAAPTTNLAELPAGVDLHVLPSPTTTTFANLYTEQGRVQYTYAQALPIVADDIAPRLRRPQAVLLGPLVDEISPDVAPIFAPDSLVAAVPQGWMRRWDADGRIHAKPWESAAAILPHLDVLVLSREDIDYDLSRLEPWFADINLIVLTEYREGSTIYQRNAQGEISLTKIPPRPANEIDPTGAGDVFATAFVIRLQEIGDAPAAARFANVTASFSVEHVGVSGVPTREQVLTYMDAHPVELVAQN
jgi:1D-myo-inositol 3-kinase